MAVLMSTDGTVLDSHYIEYPLITTKSSDARL
jgi:hypothetical protein